MKANLDHLEIELKYANYTVLLMECSVGYEALLTLVNVKVVCCLLILLSTYFFVYSSIQLLLSLNFTQNILGVFL